MNTTVSYDIRALMPYVNWPYLYHAWGVGGDAGQCARLRDEAEALAAQLDGSYRLKARVAIYNAWSEGDDIVIRREGDNVRLPMLRQQTGARDVYLCLADFVSPVFHDGDDYSRVGVFACTIDGRMEHLFDDDPYRRMLVQTLCDRLAEAAAERLHEEVRRRIWGYAAGESLGIGEMLRGRYQGIRPAVGYPCLPDVSVNFVLDRLIDMRSMGIRLTENGAMIPHASVSGLMMAHPRATYFDVGRVTTEQLHDYARRRGVEAESIARFLEKE